MTLAEGVDFGSPVSGVADANGRPMIGYASDDGALHLIRCSDTDCAGTVDDMVLGHPGSTSSLELAQLGDGSPVIVVQPWETDYPVVYLCSDPDCTNVETSELRDPEPCVLPDGSPCTEPVMFPVLSIASDGLPRVIFFTQSDPGTLRLAICQTRSCTSWDWVDIDEMPSLVWLGAPSAYIDSTDRMLIGYGYERGYDDQQARIAICEDSTCDAVTILTFEDASTPQVTRGTSVDNFLVWYKTGSASLPPSEFTDEDLAEGASAFPAIWSDYADFMVAECAGTVCAEATQVDLGEDWLLPYPFGFEFFEQHGGTTAAFFHHASRTEPDVQLHISACVDLPCTSGTTRPLGPDTIQGVFMDVITSPHTYPMAIYVSDAGELLLFMCGEATCGLTP